MSEPIKAVLIDLNGTIHVENLAFPGCQEALNRLRSSGIKIKFVTNTTEFSMRILHEHLQHLGFFIEKEEIFSSLTASRKIVDKRKLRPYLIVDPRSMEDFEGVDTRDPNAVVLGLAPSCYHYDNLDSAFRLMLGGAPLIAMYKTRYYPLKDGLNHLGIGAFVTGLEYATDTKAEVVGKPEKSFFMQAMNELNVQPENTVMIGDDVRDDVEGAMKAGMRAILVQTGKYRPGDEKKIFQRPTRVCKDFPSAVDWLLEQIER